MATKQPENGVGAKQISTFGKCLAYKFYLNSDTTFSVRVTRNIDTAQ